ncbi:MAG: DNA translocase FtsK 4TM domain-containing protein [Desulfobacterales bacterium]
MRREFITILKLFLLIFVLFSLLSHHPADLENLAWTDAKVHNLFGVLGACFSGAVTALFGLGSFWLPMMMILANFQITRNYPRQEIIHSALGGLMLMTASGSFLALWGDSCELFGSRFSSGGMIGIFLNSLIVGGFSRIGGTILLSLFLLIAFSVTTGISLHVFGRRIRQASLAGASRTKEALEMWRVQGHPVPRLPFLSEQPVKKLIPPLPKGKKNLPPPVSEKISEPEKTVQIQYTVKTAEPADAPHHPDNADAAGFDDTANESANHLPDDVADSAPTHSADNRPATAQEPLGDSPIIVPPVIRKSPKERKIFPALFAPDRKGFQLPPIGFLTDPANSVSLTDMNHLNRQARMLQAKLDDFGVRGEVVKVIPGPVITTFEYRPASGVKINRILNLTDDLALALRAMSIRIVAPIPGRSVIGIEVPNAQREIVRLKEVINSPEFKKSGSRLTLCLGKDIVGNPVVAQLDQMPHLLIAGATGTGKSVGLNSMICSLLYKASPDEVKMVLIDPKRIELSLYEGIPHLITPVVTDVRMATNALFWAVSEMERRYQLLSDKKARNITQYNRKVEKENREKSEEENKEGILPYIVVIIDELSDLMMVASKDVEFSLLRLAQMARASGIHLILATQRPSVDVLTGVIKANFPTRLTYRVSSKTDSRTIIDANGAQSLLGNGDLLFLPPGTATLQRIHGAYISEDEVTRITDFLKDQQEPEYNESILEGIPGKDADREEEREGEDEQIQIFDERYDDAVALVTQAKQVSVTLVQRHLRIGYKRAAKLIEIMEKEGVISPPGRGKSREVLVRGYEDLP